MGRASLWFFQIATVIVHRLLYTERFGRVFWGKSQKSAWHEDFVISECVIEGEIKGQLVVGRKYMSSKMPSNFFLMLNLSLVALCRSLINQFYLITWWGPVSGCKKLHQCSCCSRYWYKMGILLGAWRLFPFQLICVYKICRPFKHLGCSKSQGVATFTLEHWWLCHKDVQALFFPFDLAMSNKELIPLQTMLNSIFSPQNYLLFQFSGQSICYISSTS